MNPYKKIRKLESRIKQLECENKELLYQYNKGIRLQKEYELKNKLLEESRMKYQKISDELNQSKKELEQLIHRLKFEINKTSVTYRKALHEIKKDINK